MNPASFHSRADELRGTREALGPRQLGVDLPATGEPPELLVGGPDRLVAVGRPADRLLTGDGAGQRHPLLGQVPELRGVDPEVLPDVVDVPAVEALVDDGDRLHHAAR